MPRPIRKSLDVSSDDDHPAQPTAPLPEAEDGTSLNSDTDILATGEDAAIDEMAEESNGKPIVHDQRDGGENNHDEDKSSSSSVGAKDESKDESNDDTTVVEEKSKHNSKDVPTPPKNQEDDGEEKKIDERDESSPSSLANSNMSRREDVGKACEESATSPREDAANDSYDKVKDNGEVTADTVDSGISDEKQKISELQAECRDTKRKVAQNESVAPAAKKMKESNDAAVPPDSAAGAVPELLNAQLLQDQQQQMQLQQLHQMMNTMNHAQMNQMMNPQFNQQMMMMNAQNVMNQQMMMNAQMFMNQQRLNAMVPPPAPAANNIATPLMNMMGIVSPEANQNPTTSTYAGSNNGLYTFILTLPPSNIKLGMLIEDNTELGCPELMGVALNSPIRHQLPPMFHHDCCVLSLRSEVVGHVQPRSAKDFAAAILKAQQGLPMTNKLEIVLVPVKEGKLSPPSPPEDSGKKKPSQSKGDSKPSKSKTGPKKTDEDRLEYNRQKKLALLDFFTDNRYATVYEFCKETKQESLRTTMTRVLKSNPQLAELAKKRNDAAKRKQAYAIIERLVPDLLAEKAAANSEKKAALCDFFADSGRSTLVSFCYDKKLNRKMRGDMEKVIDYSPSLMKLVNQRHIPKRRDEASKIIERLLPDIIEKEASKKAKRCREMKTVLLTFFGNSEGITLTKFCEENSIEDAMRASMMRFMDSNHYLAELVDKRQISECREVAFSIIEKLLPTVKTPSSKKPSSKQSSVSNNSSQNKKAESDVDVAAKTKPSESDFFHPDNIKNVASSLDFEARPRMTRNGSKEIELHDQKVPHELLIFSTLDLSNRVLKGRALSGKDKSQVLEDCARILYYDHGYKKVRGASNIFKTWETRLEKAYISGADTNPLQARYVEGGKIANTDKVEKAHPGLLEKLYGYTVERIGKEASYRDQAAFMNEKAMEDRDFDPTMPELKLNASTLYRWVKKQGGVDMEGAEKQKPSTDGPMSLDQIEKNHPDLIEELYSFAVEALGPDASYHMLAICMNERSKEDVEEDPTLPLVVVSKTTLPNWIKKRDL